MALIQVNFVSKCLFRTVPMNVILPVDKIGPSGSLPDRFKALYLLHGLLGNYTDWVTGTRIQRWAEERNLAVVMPSGDNSFYVDNEASGDQYGRFIGEELVDITRRMFPLSDRREDTFIGGLSMGGYGAVRNGLKYHETFSHIIALSSALHLLEPNPETIGHELSALGNLEAAAKGDKNPRVLIDRLSKSGAPLPKVYLACGSEDSLLACNHLYRDLFRAAGFDLTWYEGPGAHDWSFWDDQIRRALDWLPLNLEGQGVNSGHVHA